MSFATLKRNKGNFAELREAIKTATKTSYEKDERIWKLTTDKTGKGEAVIRFLPTAENDTAPFVLLYTHFFKSERNQWYISNCQTTLGQDCPCCDENSKLYATGIKANQDLASSRKRVKRFYSNIYIINDPANPENNGKNMIFEYGPAIFKMIEKAMNPEFASQQPINVFDLWEGANFTLRSYMKDTGFISYDQSDWSSPTPLSDDDSKLEAIYNQQYSLSELIAPSKFKTYAEDKERLDKVLGNETTPAQKSADIDEQMDKVMSERPVFKQQKQDQVEQVVEETVQHVQKPETKPNDNDDVMSKYMSMLD